VGGSIGFSLNRLFEYVIMIYGVLKKKKSSGECVKVTKYETNLKEAHQRVPNKDERLEFKKR
jgi:hypothetical protein